jgi:NIPSNAP
MTNPLRSLLRPSVLFLAAGFVAGALAAPQLGVVSAQTPAKVFELRTYTAPDGKLTDLHKRFRDHTMRIFQKHGMTNVIYLSPTDAPLSQNTLVYLLSHQSREAAKKSWADFAADPEWKKVSAESQVNGRIVEKVESVFLTATDYSPMK